MSALTLEIAFADRSSFADRIAHTFSTAFAGCILPAHLVQNADKESQDLLTGEEVDRELFATYFSGAPITAELIRRARAEPKPLIVWCAFVAGFPKQGSVAAEAFLRFAFDAGRPTERFVPILSATLAPQSFRFTFAANGAPILPPPSRDQGGPIDRAWARSVSLARADLSRGVQTLKDVELHLSGENVPRAALENLAKEVPSLIVDQR